MIKNITRFWQDLPFIKNFSRNKLKENKNIDLKLTLMWKNVRVHNLKFKMTVFHNVSKCFLFVNPLTFENKFLLQLSFLWLKYLIFCIFNQQYFFFFKYFLQKSAYKFKPFFQNENIDKFKLVFVESLQELNSKNPYTQLLPKAFF